MSERTRVPKEAGIITAREQHIKNLADSVRSSTSGLWDFGREYSILNQDADFNYRALARNVKDQHHVDLYPPSVATRLRKAYETYVIEAGVPMEVIRRYSPYYLYELSVVVDITRKNVDEWLDRVAKTPRAELMEQIKGRGEGNGATPPKALIRVPEEVYERIQEAQAHLGASVGTKLSTTVLMEFVTELILNTQGVRLRKLWDIMHGEQEE